MGNGEQERFDAIIVGGGLAGLAAAYTLAGEGLEVLVLERGDYCGAKNVTGGRLYVNPVRELFPQLWAKAPFERFIAHEEVSLVAPQRSVTVRYWGQELAEEPRQSFSVLRARFDRWLARQAESRGAAIVTRTRVDDVVREGERVVGVWAGGEELHADVVIACDGVLSLTAQRAGLRRPMNPAAFAVGCKEVIELPREVLEARFNLQGEEGAARLFMGEVTRGRFGGGFLYTNQASVSLGLVVGIAALDGGEEVRLPELLDEFKRRPEVARLLAGGNLAEYSAHVVPEGGLDSMGPLYGHGILVAGDAAGLAMNIGVTVRGMEYALASGYYAAQAVLQARQAGDFSAASLARYEAMLRDSFVLKDFTSFREAPHVLDNPRLFQHYPELVTGILREVYAVPAGPKDRLFATVARRLDAGQLWQMARDAWRLRKI